MSKVVFRKDIPGQGEIIFRPFDLSRDISAIYSWVSQPYAIYWGMNGLSMQEVTSIHKELLARQDYDIFIGELNGDRVCMMERYKVTSDILARYFEARDTDYGMHILVAPAQKRIKGFTWLIFTGVMDFMFSCPDTARVVVEPDSSNEKIHVLNKKAGFIYQKEIQLPHKRARLAWCTQEDYRKALIANTQKVLETNE